LLRAVMRRGPVARKDLAAATGISTGTVTKLIAALSRAGLVRQEGEPVQEGLGRPKVPVVIDQSRYAVAGVHFGDHHTIPCRRGLAGIRLDQTRRPAPGPDPAARIAQAAATVRTITDRPPYKILGVGASTGGSVDATAGRVLEQPVLGWHDVTLGPALSAA